MIELNKLRIVELSQELQPGVHKVSGQYRHAGGAPPYGNRRLEIRQWINKDDQTFMHWIETETHIGTHVEAPSHLNLNGKEGGKSVSELPRETWIGEAVVLNLSHKKPVNGKGQPITQEDLRDVRDGDIVILWSTYPEDSEACPYVPEKLAQYLVEKKIRQFGIAGIGLPAASHDMFLRNGVPLIEGLAGLGNLKKERVFYIGVPLKWRDLDSCPITALALEEK